MKLPKQTSFLQCAPKRCQLSLPVRPWPEASKECFQHLQALAIPGSTPIKAQSPCLLAPESAGLGNTKEAPSKRTLQPPDLLQQHAATALRLICPIGMKPVVASTNFSGSGTVGSNSCRLSKRCISLGPVQKPLGIARRSFVKELCELSRASCGFRYFLSVWPLECCGTKESPSAGFKSPFDGLTLHGNGSVSALQSPEMEPMAAAAVGEPGFEHRQSPPNEGNQSVLALQSAEMQPKAAAKVWEADIELQESPPNEFERFALRGNGSVVALQSAEMQPEATATVGQAGIEHQHSPPNEVEVPALHGSQYVSARQSAEKPKAAAKVWEPDIELQESAPNEFEGPALHGNGSVLALQSTGMQPEAAATVGYPGIEHRESPPCEFEGPALNWNGSVLALPSPEMQPRAAAATAKQSITEIQCTAFSPSEELDGDDGNGQEALLGEWESVSEAGSPIVIQVVLCDPSLFCPRCVAAETHGCSDKPNLLETFDTPDKRSPPEIHEVQESDLAAAGCLSVSPGPTHAFPDFWDSSHHPVVGSVGEPEIWDLEACRAELRSGSDRPSTSDSGSEARTRRTRCWRHLLTPVSSPFSLACSDDSSAEVRQTDEPHGESDCVDASSSAVKLDVDSQEPIRLTQHLETPSEGMKPKSVHSMETGFGAGSSVATHLGGSLLSPLTRTSCNSEKGLTPLHVAAEIGNAEAVQALLQSGAAVDAATSDGFTPLHGAAKTGCSETVASLISARADPCSIAADGSTALHGAARHGHVQTVGLLLERGSMLDPKDHIGGFSPLHDAAHGGHLAMVQLLLARRADPSPVASGTTPLDLGAHGGHAEVVAALLAARAWPRPDNPRTMLSPLRLAARGNHQQVLRLLLSRLREAAAGG